MTCPHCNRLRQQLAVTIEALAVATEELERAHAELADLRPPATGEQLRRWQQNAQLEG